MMIVRPEAICSYWKLRWVRLFYFAICFILEMEYVLYGSYKVIRIYRKLFKTFDKFSDNSFLDIINLLYTFLVVLDNVLLEKNNCRMLNMYYMLIENYLSCIIQ